MVPAESTGGAEKEFTERPWRNYAAEFRGDSGFPNSALRYFRSGRTIELQTLYGLERRLAWTFERSAGHGVLKR
ncbi:hypothetical protein DL768_011714 [Monosporascus sp. mg162]|nr:hypothetical protein DL768_011714 [Monosporascus sp. mg162]